VDWTSFRSRLISASPAELILPVDCMGCPQRSSIRFPWQGQDGYPQQVLDRCFPSCQAWRLLFPSGVSVSISPVKSSGICEGSPSRVGIDIPRKSKIEVSPLSVGGSYPPAIPQADWVQRRFFPSKGFLFPSSSDVPHQGGDWSDGEFLSRAPRASQKSPLRGIPFYAFIT
jgi:hypothetical protein